MKRIFAFLLTAAMLPGLCACGTANAPAETADAEKHPLRVLVLGHSLALDSSQMLSLIAATEGGLELKLGTLYYSGCNLYQHVEFMNTDADKYNLYASSTAESYKPLEKIEHVTMAQAIAYDAWDLIVMQGGVFEITESGKYTDGNIQKIQTFVNKHKKNPDAVFAWHMPWAPPVDEELRRKYPYEDNPYITRYLAFGNDRSSFYEAITRCVEQHILTDDTFTMMIPTGTAMENALSGYPEERDLHRDYVHATDFGRIIAGYTWYCKLAGVSQLDELKLETVPFYFLLNKDSGKDLVLTDTEKKLVLESVNNALKEPLKMTPSQYTDKA